MIYHLSFYILSIVLSYTDCTRYKIPNITIVTILLFLLVFGFLENQINPYSLIVSCLILVFFVIILLVMPKIILGGGDIKYIMVIAIYLDPMQFPLFLVVTGLMQMCFLIYFQKIKKRRVAPMAPAIFLSVIIIDILYTFGVYPV